MARFMSYFDAYGTGLLLALLVILSPLQPLEGLRLVVLALLLAIELSRSRGGASQPWPPVLIWLPWLAWAAASFFWSHNPSYTVYYWLQELLPTLLVFVLGYRLALRGVGMHWLAWGVGLMLALMTLLSLGHAAAPAAWPLYYPGWLDNEPQATAYLVLAQLLACVCLLHGGRGRYVIGLLLLVGIQVVAWMAVKRVPYVAMFVQALLVPLLLWRAPLRHVLGVRLLAPLAIFAVVTVVAALHVVQVRPMTHMPAGQPAPTLRAAVMNTDRAGIWQFWLHEGRQHWWLGVGAGRYLPNHVYYPVAQPGVDPWARAHAHNALLNQWLQLGVPGALAYAAIWFWLLWQMIRLEGDKNCHSSDVLRALAFGALLSMVIRNGTDDVLFGACGNLWWLCCGFMASRLAVRRRPGSRAGPGGPEVALSLLPK